MKKTIAILLSAMMVLSLAGCTEKETTKKKTKSTKKTEETEDPDEDDPTTKTKKPSKTEPDETPDDTTTDTMAPTDTTPQPSTDTSDPWETITNLSESYLYGVYAEDLVEWADYDLYASQANDVQKAAYLTDNFNPADPAFKTASFYAAAVEGDLHLMTMGLNTFKEDTPLNAAIAAHCAPEDGAYVLGFVIEAKDNATAEKALNELVTGAKEMDLDSLPQKAKETDIQFAIDEGEDYFHVIVISENDYDMVTGVHYYIDENIVCGCLYTGPYSHEIFDEYYDFSYDAFDIDIDEILEENAPLPEKPDKSYSTSYSDRSSSVIDAAKDACGAKEATDEQKKFMIGYDMDPTDDLFKDGAYCTVDESEMGNVDLEYYEIDAADIKNATFFCKSENEETGIMTFVIEAKDEDKAWEIYVDMVKNGDYTEDELKEFATGTDLKYAFSKSEDELLVYLISEEDYQVVMGMYFKYEGTVVTISVLNGEADSALVGEYIDYMKKAGFADIQSMMK